jgi:predicted DNA-binding transcriptional regulator YafY
VTRLARLLRIDGLIRAGGYPNAEQLSEILEVRPRTVFQDVKELRELFGLEISFDRGRGGYFNANPGKKLPMVALGPDEALALMVAAELLYHFGGNTFRGVLEPALMNLLSGMDDLKTGFAGSVAVQLSSVGISARLCLALLRAISTQEETVLCQDQAADIEEGVTIIPEQLVLGEDGWLVSGCVPVSGESVLVLLVEPN